MSLLGEGEEQVVLSTSLLADREEALALLQLRHPTAQISCDGQKVRLQSHVANGPTASDVLDAFYRAKIFREGAILRQLLREALVSE